jgi:hypothetical protein
VLVNPSPTSQLLCNNMLTAHSSNTRTSHCLALKNVDGPTGGPSAGGTTMRPAGHNNLPYDGTVHRLNTLTNKQTAVSPRIAWR